MEENKETNLNKDLDGKEKEEKQSRIKWILLLLLLFIMGVMVAVSQPTGKPTETPTPPPTFEGGEWNGELVTPEVPQENNQYIEMPGYVEFTVTKDAPTIPLVNPESNKVFIKYTLTLDGEEIYVSNLVKPGHKSDADMYNLVKSGENTVTILMETFEVETMVECNSLSMDFTIIKK